MEDDDEFGDLYIDVLQPFTTSSAPIRPPFTTSPQPQPPSIDIKNKIPSDDEEVLYGAPGSSKLNFDANLNLNENDGNSVKVETHAEAAVAANSGARVLAKVDEKGFEEDRSFRDGCNGEILQVKEENLGGDFGIEDAGGEELKIPGLARAPERVGEEGEGGDDWDDSDGEDDLQIVLNDDDRMGMMRMEGIGGEDDMTGEDGDNLVIIADNDDPNHHQAMVELQDWDEDASQAGEGGGDRKDILGGDAGKVQGGEAVAAPKTRYSNQGFYPFHSQFKYVRPGAAPIPGAASTAPGQVRPPAGMLPFAGCGRGDWRPTGIKNAPPMQKNFHPGYGMPGWGNNGAGRGYGTGLDFTLPSHKTIFEVDIDGFEEKPWRLQAIDISDFFNFGLNEESWKEYCKQLEQLRLEATMQSRIRVYESGRTEQEYDPDLPPELAAAAAGIHDIPSENQNIGKTDLQSDLVKGSARARMQLPSGRPIQVETCFSERLPSIDTRPPRIRDSDAIIEIVLQDTADQSVPGQADDDPSKENLKVEENVASEDNHFDSVSQTYNGRKRRTERRSPERSPRLTYSGDLQDEKSVDNQKEESTESGDAAATDTFKDEKLTRTEKKQKLLPQAGQSPSRKIDDEEYSKAAKSRENGLDEEVVQAGSGNIRRPYSEDECSVRRRHQTTSKAMEDPYSCKKWDSSSQHLKSENSDRRKRRDSEGVWQDEDLHVGRTRTEDRMKRHRRKVRESERSDKDEHRSRKVLENGSWKGDHDRDMLYQQNGEDGFIHSKRRKEEMHARRGNRSERDESFHAYKERIREKDDNLDPRKKDEQARLRDNLRYKEEGWIERPREQDEWREREGHEEVRREDKTWTGHSRLKEGHRSVDREYRVENETLSRHRGHGSKLNNDEKKSRQERGTTGTNHSVSATDMTQVSEKKHKESARKSKETGGGAYNSPVPSRRNQEDQSNNRSERVRSRGVVEQESREHVSSEEEHEDSRRGRSKFERWKEDLSHNNTKESDGYNDVRASKPPKSQEVDEKSKSKSKSNPEDKDGGVPETKDKHLDTVEKLKKHSERFKLPMPTVRKTENEAMPERADIKPERPARKRRWT